MSMSIKEIRKKTGLSQSQFAERYHINLRTLKSWEGGERNAPEQNVYLLNRVIELEKVTGLIELADAEKNIKFKNHEHREDYRWILEKMKKQDCYHQAVAYLLALDEVLVDHVDDVFDFSADTIHFETAMNHGWQTGTSYKTTRLIMNLWNGWCCDFDDEGEDSFSPAFVVSEIFCCEYALYYMEAIKLRYPEYCKN